MSPPMITITVSARDANHAAFALRRSATRFRKVAANAYPGVKNGFTILLNEQADAADRVAELMETATDGALS